MIELITSCHRCGCIAEQDELLEVSTVLWSLTYCQCCGQCFMETITGDYKYVVQK